MDVVVRRRATGTAVVHGLAVVGVGGSLDHLSHVVEALVGVIDVRLLRGEIGVGHATRMSGSRRPEREESRPATTGIAGI